MVQYPSAQSPSQKSGNPQKSLTPERTESINRLPAKNTAFSIHFIIRGAEKRRNLAYAKAKMLQRELGVIPRLTCVK